MKKMPYLLIFLLFFLTADAVAVFDLMSSPSLQRGAQVYKERCVLCHNQNGDGEGLLPASMLFLEKPNLLDSKYSDDEHSLRYIIVWGGMENKMSTFSPPWGDTLTWAEIESVILFINYLREHNKEAVRLLSNFVLTSKPDIKAGETIFQRRCSICHGESGRGDGRIAKSLKGHVVFNLTKSRLIDRDLKKIISQGGKGVARSEGMPAWGDVLTDGEIDSLVLFLKTLRQ
jgi:mono/diheme cytochrome c family protein